MRCSTRPTADTSVVPPSQLPTAICFVPGSYLRRLWAGHPQPRGWKGWRPIYAATESASFVTTKTAPAAAEATAEAAAMTAGESAAARSTPATGVAATAAMSSTTALPISRSDQAGRAQSREKQVFREFHSNTFTS